MSALQKKTAMVCPSSLFQRLPSCIQALRIQALRIQALRIQALRIQLCRRGALLWRGMQLILLVGLAGGCGEVAYYWQAGLGQWEILSARRPISEVLIDPEVPPLIKDKLQLVRSAQAYGQQALHLPLEAGFEYYSDLGRENVSWLVVASVADAIQAYQNCFLIVGCLSYRGFFAHEDAQSFAAQLKSEGYDVLVRPVRVYSTLGWFDDPVLNTYIRSADTRLVATVFHEQAHQLLFVKGDTAFSESFATFVEQEGLARFLTEREGGQGELKRYRRLNRERELFRQIVLRGRERLERLYRRKLPSAVLRRKKQSLFQAMRLDYQKIRNAFKLASYDAWFAQNLNNAHLVGFAQYRSWLGAFEILLKRQGGDLPRFYTAARKLAALPPAERKAQLEVLEASSVYSATVGSRAKSSRR